MNVEKWKQECVCVCVCVCVILGGYWADSCEAGALLKGGGNVFFFVAGFGGVVNGGREGKWSGY